MRMRYWCSGGCSRGLFEAKSSGAGFVITNAFLDLPVAYELSEGSPLPPATRPLPALFCVWCAPRAVPDLWQHFQDVHSFLASTVSAPEPAPEQPRAAPGTPPASPPPITSPLSPAPRARHRMALTPPSTPVWEPGSPPLHESVDALVPTPVPTPVLTPVLTPVRPPQRRVPQRPRKQLRTEDLLRRLDPNKVAARLFTTANRNEQ